MKKNLQLWLVASFLLNFTVQSQDSVQVKVTTLPSVNGYYQTIDLNADTPCGCDSKTERTYQLSKGLLDNDLVDYSLHAYKFKIGNTNNAFLKLFKAFENDPNVYKLSVKKWDSFMLVTTKKFDVASFEKAASIAMENITPILPEEYLKEKNINTYNVYMQFKQQAELQKNQK
jgi:hypothetical protein